MKKKTPYRSVHHHPTKKPWPTRVAFRMPDGILEGLDGWIDDLNGGRMDRLFTRSDLVRILICWGFKNRPDIRTLMAESR